MPSEVSKYTKMKAKRAYNKQVRNLAKQATNKTKLAKVKTQQELKRQKRLNPNTRRGRSAIVKDEKLKLKQTKLKAQAELAAKDPKFAEMKLKNKLEIAKIAEQGTAGAAKATAIGTAAAEMSKAIVNENDDDDEKDRQQETINALIYGQPVQTTAGNNSGLEEGVL